MEDVTVRAITIGVGVVVSIITITAVLTYYNTAKETVREIGAATDISGLYDKSIEDILLKKKITGTDIKNIFQYFEGRNDVTISIETGIKTSESPTEGITEVVTLKNNLGKILPNENYSLNHSLSNGILTININKL